MNHDDISTKVKRISLKEGTSRSGKDYVILTLHFVNGYDLGLFVKPDQKFGVKDALAQKTNDNDLELDKVD